MPNKNYSDVSPKNADPAGGYDGVPQAGTDATPNFAPKLVVDPNEGAPKLPQRDGAE